MGETLLFAPLRQRVAQRVFRPFANCYDIVPAALGEEMVVHGALALARKRLAGTVALRRVSAARRRNRRHGDTAGRIEEAERAGVRHPNVYARRINAHACLRLGRRRRRVFAACEAHNNQ